MKRLLLLLMLVLGSMATPRHTGAQSSPAEIAILKNKAAAGDATAQLRLGQMYDNGTGAPQDKAEAVKWYRLAAAQGLANAQFSLGAMYYFGEGVPENKTEAVKWYRLAADQGNVIAQSRLGDMYRLGTSVPQDFTEAAKWYRLAAAQGDVDAQHFLGLMATLAERARLKNAEVIKALNLPAEIAILKNKAAAGDATAQYSLGYMSYFGEGVPENITEAVKWYRLAAARGDVRAQFNLGLRYDIGEGVVRDEGEAVNWYRLAAAQGLADAQYLLGVALTHSDMDLPADRIEAAKWFRLAAAQGNAIAQYNLGVMYSNGTGVPQDNAEAVKWYRLAAAQGEAYALMSLAIDGKGVPANKIKIRNEGCDRASRCNLGTSARKDLVQAYKWWNLAAAAGNADAVEWKRTVAKKMTKEEIVEAQRLSTAFKPTKKPSIAYRAPLIDSGGDSARPGATQPILTAELDRATLKIVESLNPRPSEGGVFTRYMVEKPVTEAPNTQRH